MMIRDYADHAADERTFLPGFAPALPSLRLDS
jgi:hypothetical protein